LQAGRLTDLAHTPLLLEGNHVRLEPLASDHAPDLFAVAQDEEVWRWLYVGPPATVADLQSWIAVALAGQAGGTDLPFAVIDRASGRAIGSTRYLNVEPAHRHLDIGWTWYGRAFWRTAVNTECKYLLLRHAFEALGCVRVGFTTDLRNARSQQAIERLGATREGVLRKYRIVPKDGYARSSVFYSIVDDEWPTVKARLESRLSRSAPSARGG
jgi:RimJ/RimL family protein N-acetyltransferase